MLALQNGIAAMTVIDYVAQQDFLNMYAIELSEVDENGPISDNHPGKIEDKSWLSPATTLSLRILPFICIHF